MTRLKMMFLGLILSGCATTIKGKVVPSDAKSPLVGGKVNVQRLDAANGPRLSLVTDLAPDGSFETPGDLPPGEYLVEPLIPGFTSESKTVKTSDGHDLLFKASPLAAPKRSAIGARSDAMPARGEGAAVLTPPQM